MALLRKLKSLLGLDEGQSSSDRSGDDSVGVTVEHDRSDDRTTPEPEPGSGSAAETEPEGPPIGSGPETESIGQDPAEAGTDAEGPVDEETASNPEEAPPGTDAPGTETAEPAPAETGESSEEGAGVDGTVDVEPDVESPEPEGGTEPDPDPQAEAQPGPISESGPSTDVDAETEPDGSAETEPEIGGSTADEGEPTDEALQDLKGIGPSYETTLSEAGVETVDDLADADADELADDTGLSTKRVQRWIDRARSR